MVKIGKVPCLALNFGGEVPDAASSSSKLQTSEVQEAGLQEADRVASASSACYSSVLREQSH
eukprot:4784569-Amphidinium_carterae.1